jgi:signal peptidase
VSLTDRSTLRRAANVLGVVVLIALVAPFVVYGVPQVVGADQSFVVLSGSMEPAMSPGDVVVVRDAAVGSIAAGDVITYRTDSATPTTHRVIEVVEADDGTAYLTKGDANEDPDSGLVTHDRVIGTVFLTIPLLGHAIAFVNTPVGFAAVVVIPLVLFVGAELRSLVGSISAAAPGATSTAGAGGTDPSDGDRGGTDAAGTVAGEGQSADGDGPEAESTVDGNDTDSGGASLTLTRSSLQIIILIFGVYLPYSAYVASELRTSWSITMAIATAIGLLFVIGLHSGSRSGADADDGAGDDPDDDASGAASEQGDADDRTTDDAAGESDVDDVDDPISSPTAAADGGGAPNEDLIWQVDPTETADDTPAADPETAESVRPAGGDDE